MPVCQTMTSTALPLRRTIAHRLRRSRFSMSRVRTSDVRAAISYYRTPSARRGRRSPASGPAPRSSATSTAGACWNSAAAPATPRRISPPVAPKRSASTPLQRRSSGREPAGATFPGRPTSVPRRRCTSRSRRPVDAVLSVFGALHFTPPELLLPLIADRLRPGGRLALFTIHPVQRTCRPWDRLRLDDGASIPIRRPLPSPIWWAPALAGCDLDVDLELPVAAPAESLPCCLILVATRHKRRR